MTIQQSRRQNLKAGFASLIAAIWGMGNRAADADSSRTNILIGQFTGAKVLTTGKVHLDFPGATVNGDTVTVENGNVVPMTVTVDSPMNGTSYVTDVLVVADGNAQPTVVTFHFIPESGSAEASTRIRLAKSGGPYQTVTAVAKMNDGSCYQSIQKVAVADTGCG
jgi:sulfur-oxidizing protein SoxY